MQQSGIYYMPTMSYHLPNIKQLIDAPLILCNYVFVVIYIFLDIGPHNFNVKESNTNMQITMYDNTFGIGSLCIIFAKMKLIYNH